MVLGTDDKKWIKGAIVQGVIDGINQVMIPYSEEQENRFNQKFKEIGRQFEEVRNDIAKVERKLDVVTDHQADKLDNHERRIGKLELVARI